MRALDKQDRPEREEKMKDRVKGGERETQSGRHRRNGASTVCGSAFRRGTKGLLLCIFVRGLQ